MKTFESQKRLERKRREAKQRQNDKSLTASVDQQSIDKRNLSIIFRLPQSRPIASRQTRANLNEGKK